MSLALNESEVQKGVLRLMKAAQLQGKGVELVVSILNESVDLIEHRQPHGGALSADQVGFLIESGAFTPEEFAEAEVRVTRGELAKAERKTRLSAVTDTLSSAEVALKLGIDASRVRHRQAKGNLYSFLAGGKRRYPTWQFASDSAAPVVPGLSVVTRALPEDMHPATIQRFMLATQEDLRMGNVRVTPVDWLLHGGEPQAIADILEGFLQS